MDARSMKWLNLLLTLIAVGAIYYFLNDSIPENYRILFIIILIIITVGSLLVLFKKEQPKDE